MLMINRDKIRTAVVEKFLVWEARELPAPDRVAISPEGRNSVLSVPESNVVTFR